MRMSQCPPRRRPTLHREWFGVPCRRACHRHRGGHPDQRPGPGCARPRRRHRWRGALWPRFALTARNHRRRGSGSGSLIPHRVAKCIEALARGTDSAATRLERRRVLQHCARRRTAVAPLGSTTAGFRSLRALSAPQCAGVRATIPPVGRVLVQGRRDRAWTHCALPGPKHSRASKDLSCTTGRCGRKAARGRSPEGVSMVPCAGRSPWPGGRGRAGLD